MDTWGGNEDARNSGALSLSLSLSAVAQPSPEEVAERVAELEHNAIAAEDPRDGEQKLYLANREKSVSAYVGSDGNFALIAGDARVDIDVVGFEGESSAHDEVVEARTSSATQRWINSGGGISHTVELFDVVLPDEAEPLLRFAVRGLRPVTSGQADVLFLDEEGTARIKYAGLAVFDAFHRQQTAWFDVEEGLIAVYAELDPDAVWPITVDPIAQSASLTLASPSPIAGGSFGEDLATADFNDDGRDDLLIGESYFGAAGDGKVHLYFGTASGLSSTPTLTFLPTIAGTDAQCGHSVAAGDVNGDLRPDVIFGCPADTAAGRIRVHLQAANGTFNTTTPDYILQSSGSVMMSQRGQIVLAQLNNANGLEIVAYDQALRLSVFDLSNGGSTPDVPAISVPAGGAQSRIVAFRLKPTDTVSAIAVGVVGGARIFPATGTSTYLQATPVVVNTPGVTTTAYGIGASDYDCDGDSDLLVGAPDYDQQRGILFMFDNGQDGGGNPVFSQNANSPSPGTQVDERRGRAVGGADLNADGCDEVIYCGPGWNNFLGHCIVVGGSPVGINPTLRLELLGSAANEQLGTTPVTAGDYWGDGARDLAAAAIVYDSLRGRVFVVDGDKAGVRGTVFVQVEGNNENVELGKYSVVMADVTGDGRDELFVGAPGWNEGGGIRGATLVWLGGSSMDNVYDWRVNGLQTGEDFGHAIAVGRFRGTAYPPVLAVGAPLNDSSGTDRGAIRFYFLNGTTLPANNVAANMTFTGQTAGDRLGTALANTGATVVAGGDNLAAGAPGNGGKLHVFSQGPIYSPPWAVGANVGCATSFGTYVAGPGNVDSAVRNDVLVGGPNCGTSNEGKAWLYTSTGTSGIALSTWSYEANEANAELGVVVGVGDIDGDARPDFAVGAPKADFGVTDRGRVWLFRGAAGTPSTTAFGTLYGAGTGSLFGSAIAGGRDFNYDGLADWIVGAPGYSLRYFSHQGRVYVYHGMRGAFDASAELTFSGGLEVRCGSAVAVGNGNGTDNGAVYGDIAYSGPGYNGGLVAEGYVIVRKGQW